MPPRQLWAAATVSQLQECNYLFIHKLSSEAGTAEIGSWLIRAEDIRKNITHEAQSLNVDSF